MDKIKPYSNFIDVFKCDVIGDTTIRILDYSMRMTTDNTNIINIILMLITSMPSFGFKIYYRLDRQRFYFPSLSE